MSKVMISLPEAFLRDLDRVATVEHRSRSELMREAIRRYVSTGAASSHPGRLQPSVRQAATRILRTHLRWPTGQSASSVIRQLRDSRYGA